MASGVGCFRIDILIYAYIISPCLRAPRVLHLYVRLGSGSGNFCNIWGVFEMPCGRCFVGPLGWKCLRSEASEDA